MPIPPDPELAHMLQMAPLPQGRRCRRYCGGSRPSVWDSPAERRVELGKAWMWCKCCGAALAVANERERAGAMSPPAVIDGFASVHPKLMTCRTCQYDLWWMIEIIPEGEKPTTLNR